MGAERGTRARRASGAALAAVVLVAGVVLGVAEVGGGAAPAGSVPAGPGTGGPMATDPSGYTPAPDGWRWESGAGLQALVPDSWGYGVDLDSACNRNVDAGVPGAVEVPGVHTLVGCIGPEPPSHYMSFLRFDSLGPRPPARTGRWRTEEVRVAGRRVTVRSDDTAVLDRIVRSVSVVDGTDHNGCPLHHPAYADHGWRPVPVDGAATGEPDVVAVCRYGSVDRPAAAGLLSFSTVLTPARATAVLAALRAPPAGTGPDQPGRCIAPWGETVTVLRARFRAGWQDYVVRFDGCAHHGTDDGTTRRALTREVARTALVGYRGGLGDEVYRLTGDWARDNAR